MIFFLPWRIFHAVVRPESLSAVWLGEILGEERQALFEGDAQCVQIPIELPWGEVLLLLHELVGLPRIRDICFAVPTLETVLVNERSRVGAEKSLSAVVAIEQLHERG